MSTISQEYSVNKRSVILAAMALALVTGSARAQTAKPEDEVLKVVTTLFDSMRAKDTVAMRGTFAPNARLMSVSVVNGTPTVREVPIDAWIASVGRATSSLDEKIFTPEIRVDENLATVWTRYELMVNGQFQHCGYDSFQLARGAQGWKIIHIADTQRRTGCTK